MRSLIRFTEADYLALPEGFPAELIDGMLVKEPSPHWWHQAVVSRLARQFERHVALDRVVMSPIDLFVDDLNVLQPDVVILPADAGPSRSRPRIPTPILCAEVLSPSTARRDRRVKPGIYLAAGVQEVWLVDPDTDSVAIVTASGKTRIAPPDVAHGASVPVHVDLAGLFAE